MVRMMPRGPPSGSSQHDARGPRPEVGKPNHNSGRDRCAGSLAKYHGNSPASPHHLSSKNPHRDAVGSELTAIPSLAPDQRPLELKGESSRGLACNRTCHDLARPKLIVAAVKQVAPQDRQHEPSRGGGQ
jgi:hypothetical protein